MMGKILGAIAGSKFGKTATANVGGPAGAAIGVAVATLAKRVSVPTLIALTAGGYLAKKLYDRRDSPEAGNEPEQLAAIPPEQVNTPQPMATAA